MIRGMHPVGWNTRRGLRTLAVTLVLLGLAWLVLGGRPVPW